MITVNRNTTQTPITAGLTTGNQSIKFIAAPRVYIKAADSLALPTVPSTKSAGSTPAGWTDMGVVEGKAKVGVLKKTKDVKTGIDNYFRAAYTDEKVGQIDFSLSQLDDVVFGNTAGLGITGLAASVVSAGSIYRYFVGSEDLNQVALLLVLQNKLDGKEWQFYNPNAYLNFSMEETGDAMTLKVTGMLPFFTAAGTSAELMLAQTLFA